MTDTVAGYVDRISAARVVYFLFLAEFLIGPIGGLIGVVVAYVSRQDAPDWLASHYRFQIRTFWIGWLYILITIAVVVLTIGFLRPDNFAFLIVGGAGGWVFRVIWIVVRCIKGFTYELRKEAYPNAGSWLW